MNTWAIIGTGALALIAGAIALGFTSYRSAMSEAEEAYSRVAAHSQSPLKRFDSKQVAQLPEIAQRYFHHAIAAGTPLYSLAELEMHGTFLLGDKSKFRTYQMSARQALRTPDEFVWIPSMNAGAMSITGSDALVGGEAWTRFWLLSLVPVVQERTSPDLVRSAQFRAAVEGAMWLPPSLLPEHGVKWEQVGPDMALVTLPQFRPTIILTITLDKAGAVKDVVGQRWSNANREKAFRFQPFGGAVLAEHTFQGLTIPSRVAVGNHYGTDDFLPFFQAEVTRATFH